MTAKELLIRELEEALEDYEDESEESRKESALQINELRRLINLAEAGELKAVTDALVNDDWEKNPLWAQFNDREGREEMYTHAQMIEFAVQVIGEPHVLLQEIKDQILSQIESVLAAELSILSLEGNAIVPWDGMDSNEVKSFTKRLKLLKPRSIIVIARHC